VSVPMLGYMPPRPALISSEYPARRLRNPEHTSSLRNAIRSSGVTGDRRVDLRGRARDRVNKRIEARTYGWQANTSMTQRRGHPRFGRQGCGYELQYL
jgi:hypothetical protein